LNGAKTPLQHCLLPGNYIYTFWYESHEKMRTAIFPATASITSPTTSSTSSNSTIGKALNNKNGQISKDKNGKKGTKVIKDPKETPPAKPKENCLEVDFKLISTFEAEDQLTESQIPSSLLSQSVGNNQQGAFVSNSKTPDAGFLSGDGETLKWFPPCYQTPLSKDFNKLTIEKTQSFTTQQETQNKQAALFSQSPGQSPFCNGNLGPKENKKIKPEAASTGGKVTVYQPTKLQTSHQLSPRGIVCYGNNTNNPIATITKYQEHQPRKFK
jgi:hypothetical protein